MIRHSVMPLLISKDLQNGHDGLFLRSTAGKPYFDHF